MTISIHKALASLDGIPCPNDSGPKEISIHKDLASLDAFVTPLMAAYGISIHKALASLD